MPAADPGMLRAKRLGEPPVSVVRDRLRASAQLHSGPQAHEVRFGAMGTQCRVLFGGVSDPGRVASAILEWVTTFEARYSRFLTGSWVSQLNAGAGGGWFEVDPEFARLLALCGQVAFLTRGILDPTMQPLIRIWDWRSGQVPTEERIAAARALVGWNRVQLAGTRVCLPVAGMSLDLGGIGKEYAVDQVVLLVASLGATSVLVDFGADVRVHGLPPDGRPAWKIGLEDPKAPGTAWTHLILREGAVATSGAYVRGFDQAGRRYGHILDPRTGRPVDNGVLAASVLAPSCTQAGMLSTALCVLGPDEGLRLLGANPGVEGCLVTRTGVVSSKRFYEHVTTNV